MKFTYMVIAEKSCTAEKDNNISISEEMKYEYSNSDPLYAREAAFNKAKSLEDNFNETELEDFNAYSRFNTEWYSSCKITIFFRSPDENKCFEIHKADLCLSTGEDIGKPIEEEREIKEKNAALESEFKILTKYNIPVRLSTEIMNSW